MKPFAFLAPLALFGAAPAAPNWVGTVAQAPNGAYVMGNPRAKVKLVEYVSYTCSHCAHYISEATVPIKRDYIAKGLVSVELRNAVRDPFDMAASVLARCGGAARFFGNSEAIFAAQDIWLEKAQPFSVANAQKLQTLAALPAMQLISRGVGLDAIMKARGFTPAQQNACLASVPSQQRVSAMTKEAWQVRKINGTPSFLVNGAPLQGSGSWAVVEPAIQAALAAQ